MAISWRRAAATLLCAACGAAAACEFTARPAIPIGGGIPSALGRLVSPTIEPASDAAVLDPPVILRLHASELSLSIEDSSATHTVAARDTLWNIATSAGVRVDALAAANDLSKTSVLRVGRILTIPAAGTPAPATPRRARRVTAAPRPRAVRASVAVPVTPVPEQGTAAPPAAGDGAAASAAMLWPSRGIVTSRFGWRVHPIFGGSEFHTGMDIATHYGSPVVAARSGVVTFVGWKSGYGHIIVVRHDGGLATSYSHLSATLVSPGEYVAQGQLLGRIGNSGWSTGPHLFFEVRRNGVPIDPAPYLN